MVNLEVMPNTDYEFVIVIDLKNTVPRLLDQAKTIVAGIQAKSATWFNAPNPSVQTMLDLIAAVEQTQTAANTRTRGAAAARTPKVKDLRHGIKSWAGYVLGVALNNPGQEKAIIEAAGFKVKVVPKQNKPPLDARLGAKSGEVLLLAKAGPRGKSFYDWRYSVDGGRTWVQVPSTNYATTTIEGLAPATTVTFQVRLTVKNVPGEWSQPVSILVH